MSKSPTRLFASAALAGALTLFAAAAKADASDKMTFYGGAAFEITSSLENGDGWCIVSARKNVTLVEGADPVDCVRFRVVVRHASGRTVTSDGATDGLRRSGVGAGNSMDRRGNWRAGELRPFP